MTRIAGMLAAAVMLGLAALHLCWAGGGRFGSDAAIPTRDGQPLFVPGPAGTVMVAMLLGAAALVLLGRLGLWGRGLPRWLFTAGTWTIVIVFAARVVGDFRWFGIFKRMTGTPFAQWDSRLYVPLCALLALAALFVAGSSQ
jgi:hypothetical protein